MGRTFLLYLHPTVGLVAVALAAYAGSLGFRSRLPVRDAEAIRRRHAALTPWVYGLVAGNWVAGLVTVWRLRPEIELATSGHFSAGGAIVALFTAGALVSRRVPTSALARAIHPMLGAAALLLCGVQVFLGLQLLP